MYIGRPPFVQQLNDITFWYPILENIGMRTPKTQLFYVPDEIGKIVDGERIPEFERLITDVKRALAEYGGEAFLRTGQTSNKHEWRDTCHLTADSNVGAHLAGLVEFSMMVDLPYTTWAVREMIKTTPLTTAFRDMPIAQEVRMFVSKGEVVCSHPYWAREAFNNQKGVTAEQVDLLNTLPDMTELNRMAEYVSKRFDGSWSVDFLQDEKGEWWLTDMALASSSYHYTGCINEKKWNE